MAHGPGGTGVRLGGHQRKCWVSDGEVMGTQSMAWQWRWRKRWTPDMLEDGRQMVWVVAVELGRRNERKKTPRVCPGCLGTWQ